MNMDIETAKAVLDQALVGIQSARPEPVHYPTRIVDIQNPTRRVKVIYPLATRNHAAGVGIESGQTIIGVEVAEHVIEQLQEQGELVISPSSKVAQGDVAKVASVKAK